MGEPVQVAATSFLSALFSRWDWFRGKPRRAAASADAILVPSEIFAETVSLIHYRVGLATAKSAGSWIRVKKRIEVAAPSRSVLNGCWGIFRAARGRLSYPDAVVLAWCRERRATTLAFDQAILRRAKR